MSDKDQKREKPETNPNDRDNKGRFLPGNKTSGLGGRPKKENTYSDILKEILSGNTIDVTYNYGKGEDKKTKEIHITTDKNFYHGVAVSQINEALDGNIQAQKEIVDRIQGKPQTYLNIETEPESPLSDEEAAILADHMDSLKHDNKS